MKLRLLMGLVLCAPFCHSQEIPAVKFGKIALPDLEKKVYAIDTSAHAIVLSDVGSTEIVGNNKGSFSYVFKHHKRIHILNKNGYDEADVEISLYTNGNMEEKLENLKGVTYNVEGGKVVETKLVKKPCLPKKKVRVILQKSLRFPISKKDQ